MTTQQPHGPVCTGLDNGCPDCLRLQAGARDAVPPEMPAELGARFRAMKASALNLISAIDELEAIEREPIDDVDSLAADILNDPSARRAVLPPELAALYARRDADERREISRPSPADLERWNRAARDVPGPMGRCLRILLAEVARLSAELGAWQRMTESNEPMCQCRGDANIPNGPCVETLERTGRCTWCDRQLRP